MISKLFRIFMIVLLSLIILIGVVALITQTPFFKTWLKNTIEKQANTALQAELNIGKIRGNLVQTISVLDITLVTERDTVLALERLDVLFKPLELLQKKIAFQAIRIKSPAVAITQLPDSSWNLAHIAKPQTTPSQPDTSSAFQWTISLDRFLLEDGRVDIRPLDETSSLHQSVRDMDSKISIRYSQDNLSTQVDELNFNVRNSPFEIASLSFKASLQEEHLRVRQLDLQTALSHVFGSLEYNLGESQQFRVNLSAEPLDPRDIRVFVQSLPDIDATPYLNIQGEGNRDSVAVDFRATYEFQQLLLQARVGNLGGVPGYDLAARLKEIDLNTWLDQSISQQHLNGQINIQGRGLQPETMSGRATIQLRDLAYAHYRIDSVMVRADMAQQRVNANVDMVSNVGELLLDGRIKDIFGNPGYEVQSTIKHLDLSKILKDEQYNSDLNFEWSVNGYGVQPDSMNTRIQLELQPSTFSDIPIQHLMLNGTVKYGWFDIDSLQLRAPVSNLTASGRARLDTLAQSSLRLEPGDLAQLKAFIEVPDIRADGWITGAAHGAWDALSVQSELQMDVQYEDIIVESLHSNVEIELDSLRGHANIRFDQAEINTFDIKSLQFDGDFEGTTITSELEFTHHDTNTVFLRSEFSNDSLITLVLQEFTWKSGKQFWRDVSPPTEIHIGDGYYEIDDLNLQYENQGIHVHGVYNNQDSLNVVVRMDTINLALLRPFISYRPLPHGLLLADLNLSGTVSEPIISADVNLQNLQLNKYNIGSLSTKTLFKDEQFSLDMMLKKDSIKVVDVQAGLQISFSLENPSIDTEDMKPIDFGAQIKDFDIAFVRVFVPSLEKLQGKFSLDLKSENLRNIDDLHGSIGFKNGLVKVRQTESEYKNIVLDAQIQDRAINLEKLSIKAGEGNVQLFGTATLGAQLPAEPLEKFDLTLKANEFMAAKGEAMELVFNSDLQLQGTLEQPTFGGNITIRRSKIYIPAFQSGGDRENLDPLLMQETSRDTSSTETISMPNVVNNLRGRAQLEIPRNTWIRSEEMNIELMGNLDIVKESANFELFGTINTVRGTYSLYGRRLNIQSGEITFQGGTEFNPRVNIDAGYIFRDINGNKRELVLNIRGKVFSPELQFSLDGNDIEEADGFSYLLFGRSTNQLTHGEKQQMSQNSDMLSGAKVTQLLTGQLSKQLTRVLGKNLNLDVIEFSGDENWRSASIVVGKYITNDLFLRYEKEFSFGSSSEETSPERVSLEYEVTKYLYIQATKGGPKSTGFDFIFKWEK